MQNALSPDEERDLIAEIATNPDAFRSLYRHYFGRVFAYIAYRVGRQQDAEDVTADVFTRVVSNLHQFEYRGEGSFSAWIFRIAYNTTQEFHRQNQARIFLTLEEIPDIKGERLSHDEALIRKEQFARLHQMIGTLSPRRQEVITLRFFGELRNQEIAEILALDERTVASHLCRGLADLQRKYQHEDIST